MYVNGGNPSGTRLNGLDQLLLDKVVDTDCPLQCHKQQGSRRVELGSLRESRDLVEGVLGEVLAQSGHSHRTSLTTVATR
jgi:hypothetical protein